MQVTRAVRQLQKLNLFDVSKEGVQMIISGRTNHRALFDNAAPYLIDPVREILYVPKEETDKLPYSGINALAEMSMLAAPEVATRAFYSRTDKMIGENTLIDREKQDQIEVWKYNPVLLSKQANVADPLSVIVSMSDDDDPRVEQAIEGILKELWG
jgi:hypothetical protein